MKLLYEQVAENEEFVAAWQHICPICNREWIEQFRRIMNKAGTKIAGASYYYGDDYFATTLNILPVSTCACPGCKPRSKEKDNDAVI